MIICLAGLPGSGKTEVADILKTKGFESFEMGSVVKEMMRSEGIEITPTNLENYSTKLRKERGSTVYAEETLKKIKVMGKKEVVITGMRGYNEFTYLKRYSTDLVLIAILAPFELRFERLKSRKMHTVSTKEDLRYRDEHNMSFGLDEALKRADFTIVNDGSIEELKEKVEEVLSKVGV